MQPCIFCGKPTDSKEDLFPRWILKRVQTRFPMYRQAGDAPAEITDDQEVRIPCVCQKCNNGWMSGMETTVKRFLGPMIDDFYVPLDRQYQQTLVEWAVKCAMCSDTADDRPRFFTDAECRAFKEKRTIPERTQVFAARFTGRSLDSNGVDFSLIDPITSELLVRGHIYNVMVGHVVLQVLSWRPEPQHEGKTIRIKSARGPWRALTIDIWPFKEKRVEWPPPKSLSTLAGATHYGHFRERFKNATDHQLVTLKKKAQP
jgi:hypothetical protein